MTLAVLVAYLVLVLAIGLLSHRLFQGTGEDYFLATRSIGPFLLLMSLFGTHMTAFSLLGASGQGYGTGIGVFALMASSSAIVVPAVFYFVGIPLWRAGKRHGFRTQVEYFRARWDSPGLGLLLFCVLVALLVPYLLIGVMGGGMALAEISNGAVPEWFGSLAVCLVVMGYVTYGGLRGTAWANTFQTLVFMGLGAVTFVWIVRELGGLSTALDRVARQEPQLLVRGDAIHPLKMLTYTFIPLSVGMFPHIFMHWLTARSASSFKVSLVGYPLCIVVVWLPSVLLGTLGATDVVGLTGPAVNSILVQMIERHAPPILAGLLGAGVFAAIMSSLDSQVLSLGTMFTQDIVRHYGSGGSFDNRRQIRVGRLFVLAILGLTWVISLFASRSIFSLGIWSFSGFAALFPVVVAGLFWRRSTKVGVISSIVTVIVLWTCFVIDGWQEPGYTVGGSGVMPVALLLLASSTVLVVASLLSRPPEPHIVQKFFSDSAPTGRP